jgi:isopentenyl-diphosphate Delta-isomerase
MAAGEQEVVLLDEAGARVGTQLKSQVHHARTPLHLAFSSYVFDDAGRFLLSRRARIKSTFPGVRTNSCCGHPAPGESMRAAVARRLRDELGVHTSEVELLLPHFRYRAVAEDGTVENEMCPVFRVVVPSGTTPRPDPAEVDDAWWEPWDRFVADVDAGGALSPWATSQVRELRELGPDPLTWPQGRPDDLPAAAVP